MRLVVSGDIVNIVFLLRFVRKFWFQSPFLYGKAKHLIIVKSSEEDSEMWVKRICPFLQSSSMFHSCDSCDLICKRVLYLACYSGKINGGLKKSINQSMPFSVSSVAFD